MENKEIKLLTVKEYAQRAGISEQAVYKRLRTDGNELQNHAEKKDGRFYIKETALDNVIPRRTAEAAEADTLREMVALLQKQNDDLKQELQTERDRSEKTMEALSTASQAQLDFKDSLITELNNRVKELTEALQNTTNSLQAAQALHAGTLKQLGVGEENTDNSDTATVEEQPEKKKSWFARFFG